MVCYLFPYYYIVNSLRLNEFCFFQGIRNNVDNFTELGLANNIKIIIELAFLDAFVFFIINRINGSISKEIINAIKKGI